MTKKSKKTSDKATPTVSTALSDQRETPDVPATESSVGTEETTDGPIGVGVQVSGGVVDGKHLPPIEDPNTENPPAQTIPSEPVAGVRELTKAGSLDTPDTSIDDVIAALTEDTIADADLGLMKRRPEARLSSDEARLQARIYRVLVSRGVKVTGQDDVYPWLLRQILGVTTR